MRIEKDCQRRALRLKAKGITLGFVITFSWVAVNAETVSLLTSSKASPASNTRKTFRGPAAQASSQLGSLPINCSARGALAQFNELQRREGTSLVTFLGFTHQGYHRPEQMLELGTRALSFLNRGQHRVNFLDASVGVGELRQLASNAGLRSLSVVSNQGSSVPSGRSDDIVVVVNESFPCPELTQSRPSSAIAALSSELIIAFGGGVREREIIQIAKSYERAVIVVPLIQSPDLLFARENWLGARTPWNLAGELVSSLSPSAATANQVLTFNIPPNSPWAPLARSLSANFHRMIQGSGSQMSLDPYLQRPGSDTAESVKVEAGAESAAAGASRLACSNVLPAGR